MTDIDPNAKQLGMSKRPYPTDVPETPNQAVRRVLREGNPAVMSTEELMDLQNRIDNDVRTKIAVEKLREVDAMVNALEALGFTILPPDCERRYACGWDGRAVGISESRERAQEAVDAAIEQGQVGRWSLLEQAVGPWQEATKPEGARFWKEQR